MAQPKGVGILAALVGPKKPDEGGESDADDAGSSAAQALIDAVDDKDAAGVLSAFRLLYKHCEGGESGE